MQWASLLAWGNIRVAVLGKSALYCIRLDPTIASNSKDQPPPTRKVDTNFDSILRGPEANIYTNVRHFHPDKSSSVKTSYPSWRMQRVYLLAWGDIRLAIHGTSEVCCTRMGATTVSNPNSQLPSIRQADTHFNSILLGPKAIIYKNIMPFRLDFGLFIFI